MIPKTLAVNAAKDATELVAKLRAYHHTAQTSSDKQHLAQYGLDLYEGKVGAGRADGHCCMWMGGASVHVLSCRAWHVLWGLALWSGRRGGISAVWGPLCPH